MALAEVHDVHELFQHTSDEGLVDCLIKLAEFDTST